MSNTHAAREQAANQRVSGTLQDSHMYTDTNLQPLTPEDAKERYIKAIEDDKADSTIGTQDYKLRHFVRWCDKRDIKNLNNLNGRDIEDYKHWRKKDGDLKKTTVRTQMSVIRQFIEYCERINGVHPQLHEQVFIPSLEKGENRSEDTIESDRIQDILEFMAKFEYATRDHVVLLLLWKTGIRTGSLRSLDHKDYHDHKPALDLNHRPATDTPLKNKGNGERMVGLREEEVEVLNDYIRHKREDVTDEHGRNPLITTKMAVSAMLLSVGLPTDTLVPA